MPSITPLDQPNEGKWWGTFNAVLSGITTGLVGWAERGNAAITDSKVEEFMMRAEGIAARAATRQHGPLTVGGGTPTNAPSHAGWTGDFLTLP